MALVSIVVPAYNPGAYLNAAVRSVLSQSLVDWEMVIVDDGSQAPITLSFSDKRIRIIHQQNKGLSVARNVGLLNSSAALVAFLDADDVWCPDKLSLQVQMMDDQPEVGLCHTSFDIINSEGTVTGQGFQGYDRDYLELLTGCGICVSTVLIRRECLAVSGLFDPFCPAVADYDMWLKIARFYSLARVQTKQAYYRVHENNMSGNYLNMYHMQKGVLEKHLIFSRQQGDRKKIIAVKLGLTRAKQLYGAQAYEQARRSLKKRQFQPFFKHLNNAVRLSPKRTTSSLAHHCIKGWG